jgi:hypothetical protein
MAEHVKSTPMFPNVQEVLLATGIIGSATQAVGTYMEGKVKSEIQEYNAFVSEQDALQIDKSKKHELRKSRLARRKLMGRQIAFAAASGRSYSGSPLDIINRSESEALINESIIRSNSALAKGRASGQAIIGRQGAKSTKKMATSKSLSSLMSSTASHATNYFGKAALKKANKGKS